MEPEVQSQERQDWPYQVQRLIKKGVLSVNKFIIVDGLPYLLANGKVYCVRWDESGFTVGAEVEMASVPDRTYSELSILAKCAGRLDSIGALQPEQEDGNAEKVIDEMSLAELKEYAEQHDIKLGSARTKGAIIELIHASENADGDAE